MYTNAILIKSCIAPDGIIKLVSAFPFHSYVNADKGYIAVVYASDSIKEIIDKKICTALGISEKQLKDCSTPVNLIFSLEVCRAYISENNNKIRTLDVIKAFDSNMFQEANGYVFKEANGYVYNYLDQLQYSNGKEMNEEDSNAIIIRKKADAFDRNCNTYTFSAGLLKAIIYE